MSTFQYVKPTDEQIATMQIFRDLYEGLKTEIEKLPANRGRSIAITQLEDSAMWLNRGITGNY